MSNVLYVNNLEKQIAENEKRYDKFDRMHKEASRQLVEERDELRQQLADSQKREAEAIAACKLKDELLQSIMDTRILPATIYGKARKALAIQPDDSALKAWLGKPVAWEYADAFGTHYTDDRRDWMDTPGIESVTCLYSPKGLK